MTPHPSKFESLLYYHLDPGVPYYARINIGRALYLVCACVCACARVVNLNLDFFLDRCAVLFLLKEMTRSSPA